MLKLFIIFLLFFSCSGENNYLGKKEMYYLARDWQEKEWLKSGKWKESQFEEAEKKELQILHKTIDLVTSDLNEMKFNTSLSKLM